jgi:uncharacterized protein (TIGR02594 family)
VNVTAFDVASRFIGVREVPGKKNNPLILSMLKLDGAWPEHDEVPWCSAFVNFIAFILGLPRSRSLRARSWLGVGLAVDLAKVGFDVVILKRGGGIQPGPEVLDAPGHVGFFAGREPGKIAVLGGNQGDMVSVRLFDESRLLGIRSLWEE